MKVGIVGYGFVGKAISMGLKKDVEVIKIDPLLGTNIDDLIAFNPDFIFLCLPTPMKKDGSQDLSILDSVFDDLNISDIDGLIILKSTVIPDNLSALSKKLKFVYNPEFLREKYAESDFINGEIILFGGDFEACKKVSDFYTQFTLCKQKDHFITDKITASLVKYSINSFLATKVIFFNQLKSVLDLSSSDENWDKFIEIVSSDKRVGKTHMDVPGHDGREGFGGACFPKDISALKEFSSNIGANFSLISEVIKINNYIRSVYNEPTDREIEQNIFFKEKK
tara:strand:+ start:567 stop:1409 length:843 start_codon:yes stop_codon:yes gene_type:complete